MSEAEETVGLFTREGVDQVDNLQDMQCMWFEQAQGDSFLRCVESDACGWVFVCVCLCGVGEVG